MIDSIIRRVQPNILFWFLVLIVAAAALLSFKKNSHLIVIRSDGTGYYEYLPAYLQYHDPWIEEIKERRKTELESTIKYNLIKTEIDRSIIKYPMGLAILWMPFYAGAHLYTYFDDRYLSDSYSQPFNVSVAIAAIFYLCFALYLLWSLLQKKMRPFLIFITFLCMIFGTNLFHYASFDACFSHVYAFFSVALWIYALHKFFQIPSGLNAILMGISIALVFLVRNINIVYSLLFMAYFINHEERTVLFYIKVGLAIAGAILSVVPQFVYLYLGSGKLIFNSYSHLGESFTNLANPRLFFVTFSIERGFFVWAPMAFFGVLYYLIRLFFAEQRINAIFVLLILMIQVFLVASWWSPHFGGSFGHRAFVDFLPLCFLGTAYFLNGISNKTLKLIVVPSLWLALALYTTKLMLGYWDGIVPFGPVSSEIWKLALSRDLY